VLVTAQASVFGSAIPVFNVASGTWGPPGALMQAYVPCSVMSWTPTSINCTVPPGLDASVAVRVAAGGQAVVASQRTGYAPPVVTAVAPLQSLSTRGGGRIMVVGVGFPSAPWPVVVLVGGAECALDVATAGARNTTTITCSIPRGAGRAVVVVSTPRQTAVAAPGVSVVYDAPEVEEIITSQGRPIDGGFPVVVRGRVRA
jgi:hypothetical protein